MSRIKLRPNYSYGEINIVGNNCRVIIGKYCSIASGCQVISVGHHHEWITTYPFLTIFAGEKKTDVKTKGDVTIGNDVWIGQDCTIMNGVHIGDGSVVAANSTVTKDIPPYAIVGGNPAKLIKYRFDQETIDFLLDFKWWELDHKEILKLIPILCSPNIHKLKEVKNMWKFQKFRQQEFVPLIKFLIEMYHPEVYVEIGLQSGFTFNQIAPLVKEAHGVDKKLLPTVKKAENTFLFQGTSLEYSRVWPKGKLIDLLFVDGDHSKNAVLSDLDAYLPHVRPQTGLILLHDTYPSAEYLVEKGYCYSAWEAARTVFQDKKYKDIEILTLPGPYAGMSLLRKAEKHLHWRDDPTTIKGRNRASSTRVDL